MNTQVHETTGTSPYELVFGQKPRSVLFPASTTTGVVLEEDLTDDGLHFGTATSTFELPVEQTVEESTPSPGKVEEGDLEKKPAGSEGIPETDEDSDQNMDVQLQPAGQRSTWAAEESDAEVEIVKPAEGLDTLVAAEDSDSEITKPAGRKTVACDEVDIVMEKPAERIVAADEKNSEVAIVDGQRKLPVSMRESALSTTLKHKEVKSLHLRSMLEHVYMYMLVAFLLSLLPGCS